MDGAPPLVPGCDPPPGTDSGLPQWANITIGAGLVLLSGLFSGLTLGLLSLRPDELKILAEDDSQKKHAQHIQPLRQNGNLLLCTLLIGNVIVNSFFSILMAGLTGSGVGLFLSSALIVVFGEIAPQAICSRHGLWVGAKTRWITWALLVLMFPLAWPISKVLDTLLGREAGIKYDRKALMKLIETQATETTSSEGDRLNLDEGQLLMSALGYVKKPLSEALTPTSALYTLSPEDKLSVKKLKEIYDKGHTRIPVLDRKKREASVLYVKDLILLDPEDEIEVQRVLEVRGDRAKARYIDQATLLGDGLRRIIEEQVHLFICFDATGATGARSGSPKKAGASVDPFGNITGIITLEDILEKVIGKDIIDEDDKRVIEEPADRELSRSLANLSHIEEGNNIVGADEASMFLRDKVPVFGVFDNGSRPLLELIRSCKYAETKAPGARGRQLYTRGEASSTFTLVLEGEVEVTPAEGPRYPLRARSRLGDQALSKSSFVPPFSATARAGCSLLCIDRAAFQAAVDQLEDRHPTPTEELTSLSVHATHAPHLPGHSRRPSPMKNSHTAQHPQQQAARVVKIAEQGEPEGCRRRSGMLPWRLSGSFRRGSGGRRDVSASPTAVAAASAPALDDGASAAAQSCGSPTALAVSGGATRLFYSAPSDLGDQLEGDRLDGGRLNGSARSRHARDSSGSSISALQRLDVVKQVLDPCAATPLLSDADAATEVVHVALGEGRDTTADCGADDDTLLGRAGEGVRPPLTDGVELFPADVDGVCVPLGGNWKQVVNGTASSAEDGQEPQQQPLDANPFGPGAERFSAG